MKSKHPFGFLSDSSHPIEFSNLRNQLKAELEGAFEIVADIPAPPVKKLNKHNHFRVALAIDEQLPHAARKTA